MSGNGFEHHDHEHCIQTTIKTVDAECRREGLQFTPVRRRVLEILLEKHRALGAYEILDILRADGLGSQPPVAYRALDFLVKHGFAHKIERLNAFAACSHPGVQHSAMFMICRACSAIAETHIDPFEGRLGAAAKSIGFLVERAVIEVEGLCPKCQSAEAA